MLVSTTSSASSLGFKSLASVPKVTSTGRVSIGAVRRFYIVSFMIELCSSVSSRSTATTFDAVDFCFALSARERRGVLGPDLGSLLDLGWLEASMIDCEVYNSCDCSIYRTKL